jgi:hypothetical protein
VILEAATRGVDRCRVYAVQPFKGTVGFSASRVIGRGCDPWCKRPRKQFKVEWFDNWQNVRELLGLRPYS